MKKLDLLLINSNLNYEIAKKQRITMRLEKNIPNQESPYLNIAYLIASVKKAGYSSQFIDMVVDEYSVDDIVEFCVKNKPALIGFSAFTVQMNDVGIIAKAIKAKYSEAIICVGGCHVYALPLETLENIPEVDFVVRGEAENILPKILKSSFDLKEIEKIQGVITRSKKDISPAYVQDLDSLPYPAWEDFDLKKYPGCNPHQTKLELPMMTGRGCPYRCTFCCRANGGKIRRRNIQSIISEIEYLIDKFECEAIYFTDENFILDNKSSVELLDMIISKGINKKIKWGCSMRVSQAKPDIMKKMAEAGCYYVFFGFESANSETLKRVNKAIVIKDMYNAVLATKQAGIVPTGAFIIGLPGDTKDDVYKAIELGKELYLYSITFPIAVPYPGTVLRQQAQDNMWGMKILSDDWGLYGKKQNANEIFKVMESDKFSAEERLKMQRIAYQVHPKKRIKDYVDKHLKQYKEVKK